MIGRAMRLGVLVAGLLVTVAAAISMALVPLALGAAASSVTARDRAGDVRSGDLDVVAASLTRRGGRITATFRLLKPVRNNATYKAHLSSGGKLVELGAKRAAGKTTIYVLDFNSGRQVSASGAMRGRTVTVSAPTKTVGIGTAPAGVTFSAEATNGRRIEVDRVPNGNSSVRLPRG